MSEVTIVTKFKNSISRLINHFEIPETDKDTKRKIWIKEVDFILEKPKVGLTNNYLKDNNGKPWKVLTFDLTPSKVKRADGNKPDAVSVYEVIQCVAKSAPFRLAEGAIKFIVTEDNKKDIAKAIKDGLITQNNNTITDAVLRVEKVEFKPDLTAALEIDDEAVEGIDDIQKVIDEAHAEEQKKIKDDLNAKLA